MTGKRLMPELRFPEFDENWKHEALKELSSKSISYGIVQTGPLVKNGVKCVRVVDLTKTEIDLAELLTTSEEISQSYKKTILAKGEVMVALRGDIGLVSEVSAELEGSNLTRGIARIAPKRSKVISTFLIWALRSPECRIEFLKQVNGSALKEIPIGGLNKINVYYPSLPEQQKIASFLGAVDEKLSKLQRKKELLKTYKKGVMQKIFSQELRFKRDDGFDFPDWEEKKADEVFFNCSNKNHDGGLPVLSVTQESGVVRRDEVEIDIKYDKANLSSYKLVEEGDFVISLRSFQGGIEYSRLKGICSPAYTIIKPFQPICDGYFRQYFKREAFISMLSSTVIGIRDGKQISFGSFSILKIPCPCIDEQFRIAEFLSSIDKKVEALIKHINQIETFKKGLLQKMFV